MSELIALGIAGIDAVPPFGNKMLPRGIVEIKSPKVIVSEILIVGKFIESNLYVFPGTSASILIKESKLISLKLFSKTKDTNPESLL